MHIKLIQIKNLSRYAPQWVEWFLLYSCVRFCWFCQRIIVPLFWTSTLTTNCCTQIWNRQNRNKEFEVFYNICTKNEDNFCSVLRWLSQLTGYTVSAKKKHSKKNTPTNLRSSPYVDLQSSITYKHIVRIQWARREFNRFNLDTMCTVQTI